MFCGDETLVGISDTGVSLLPLFCKCWTCEACLPKRLMQLRTLAAAGEPTTLITLTTSQTKYASEDDAAKDLVRAWRLVRQRAQREGLTDKIPFLAVIEAHKNGYPHMHILCRAPYLPHAWLSAAMRELIDAPVCDIRRVYNRRHASRYIAKYVSKGPAKYDGCKRYWRSQDYAGALDQATPIADSNTRWHRSESSVGNLEWLLQNCDWHHSMNDDHDIQWYPGPEARWLWAGHDPPARTEVRRCTFLH